MSIDATAVASALGITSQFVDLREGQAMFLPQQIYVIGSGNSDTSYPTTKRRVLNSNRAASIAGQGSLIHNVVDELLPSSGGGVGTIPVFIIPLQDDPNGVAATGALDFSGTATKAHSRRMRIGGVLSRPFVVPEGAVEDDVLLPRVHEAIRQVVKMPARVGYVYGTVTSEKVVTEGASALSLFTTTGNPEPGVWRIVLTGASSFDVFEPSGALVESLTAVGAHVVGGLGFTITSGTAGDEFEVTVPVTSLTLTAKSDGEWGNDITIQSVTAEDETFGVTVAITEMSGGLLNPDIAPALAQIGNDWATMVINCYNHTDTDILDALALWGENRWGTLVHKPAVAVVGVIESDFDVATAVCDARPNDRVNCQVPAFGCANLPGVVAGAAVAKAAKIANNDPAVDYVGQALTTLTAGPDSVQLDNNGLDAAIKRGSSTTTVRNGVVYLGDMVTFYHPEEEDPPGERFVVDIVRTQNVIYNLWLQFIKPEWAAAPLIPDAEATKSKTARKPKSGKAVVYQVIDVLSDAAILTNREQAKNSVNAQIVGPRRLNISLTTAYSGNTGIKDIVHNWGFIFSNG